MNIQEEQNEILLIIKKLKESIRAIEKGCRGSPGETKLIKSQEELVEIWEEKFEQLRIMERDA